MYPKLSSLTLLFVLFSFQLIAQTYSNSINVNGTAVSYQSGKSKSKYSLKITATSTVVKQSKSNEKDVYGFYYSLIREDLIARFNSDPLKLGTIEVFARNFANQVLQQLNPNKIDFSINRSIAVDNFHLLEFKTGQGNFVYSLIDTVPGSTTSTNLLYQVSGVYKYDAGSINNPAVLKNWKRVQGFIKENGKINIPDVELIKISGQNKLYFKNSDGSTSDVNLTPAEADEFRKSSGTAGQTNSLTENSEAAVKSGAGSEKKKEALVEPQKVTCTGTTMFDLSAFSYPPDADSIEIELNTNAGKKKDTLLKTVGVVEFKRIVINNAPVKSMNCDSAEIHKSLDLFYAKLTQAIKDKKEQQVLKTLADSANKLMKGFREEMNSRVDKLAAEKDFAALVELTADPIALVKCNDAPQSQSNKFLQDTYFKVDSVTIRMFNNTVHQLDVVGTIDGKKVQTLSNYGYGLSLRDLLDGNSSLHFYFEGKPYDLCYTKIFLIRPPFDDAINYNLRDGVYKFFPEKGKNQQLVEQKRLLDFISASAFLDLQSFSESNPNKNLTTELYVNFNINNNRFPLMKNLTFGKYIYGNVTLATNIFKESNDLPSFRKTEVLARDSSRIDTATIPPFYKYDTVFATKHYLKNFDLFRYAFLQVKPVVSVMSWDFKSINTFVEVNSGMLFMASNVRTIDPARGSDSLKKVTVMSYTPMIELRCRVNPKVRYGFDFHLGYLWGPRLLNSQYQSITGDYDAETMVRAKMTDENKPGVIQGELNIFFNPRENASNTERGGFYVKLNLLKPLHYKEGFFNFLVGYSTDIKNFFK